MKAKLFACGMTLCGALIINAADGPAQPGPVQADASTQSEKYMTWDDPAWWVYVAHRGEARATIGKTDIAVTGPLLQPFLGARPVQEDRSLMDRLSGIPILGLVVPQPMPKPPGTGKYFYWGESSRAWVDVVDHQIPGPQTPLVSFSRQ